MDELSEAKTCRGFMSLRTVLRVRMLFGFYSAVTSCATLRLLNFLYCVCFAFTISIVFITEGFKVNHPYLNIFPLIVEYNLNILISFLDGDYSFFNLCKVIEQVDSEMWWFHLPLITLRVKIIFLIMCVVKMLRFLLIFIVFMKGNLYWVYIIPLILNTAVDLNNITILMPLDLLRARFVLLRQMLKSNMKRHRRDVNQQIKTINDCLKLYKVLIDKFNATFSWKNIQIMVNFACTSVIFINDGRERVLNLKNGVSDILITSVSFAGLAIAGAVTCLPAVFAELVIREVDKLKIAIGNILLECDEGPVQAELQVTGEYMELRPFKIGIFRLWELNGSLVLAFASFCISYFIVTMQVTGVI